MLDLETLTNYRLWTSGGYFPPTGSGGKYLETIILPGIPNLGGDGNMSIWVRITWVSGDIDTITKGKEYRVVGFSDGGPVVIDNENEFFVLDGNEVEFYVAEAPHPVRRDPMK